MSGSETAALLREIVPAEVSGAACARLRLGLGLELPCLVLRFVSPRSYTGEDAAELQIPGNPVLAERVLARLLECPGVRLARPGEFTARAFLNNKLSLEQGEGVGALIAARNAEELEAARELSSGRAGELHAQWADEITALLALVEAGIDFTDQEDVVAITPESLGARLGALAGAMSDRLGAAAGEASSDELPVVVLAGAPNAGKSTLFNALLGRRRAVESPIAGTTRDALRETLDLSRELPGATGVTLVDLAGLDDAPALGVDAAAQSRARAEIARAQVVVHCDPTGRFVPEQIAVTSPRHVIRVRTKADLPVGPLQAGGPVSERSDAPIAVCALDGWNLRVLRRAIADGAQGSRTGAHAMLPARHRRAIAAALASITGALVLAPRSREQPELVAGRLREAVEAISELTGRISVDDVLGRIFATFCVGK